MKKVLLVQPNYQIKKDSASWGINPPIGLAYIAAIMRDAEVDVEILDANLKNIEAEEVCRYAASKGFEIVGVSVLTPAHNYALRIARGLPGKVLSVVGGPHAAARAEDLCMEGFDIAVRGEGEYPMLEIAAEKPLKEIKGISYLNENGEIVHNQDRPFLDVDKLPFPARDLLFRGGTQKPYFSSGTRHFPWACIFTSRGCPHDCYYCNKKTFGYTFRPRSPENVVREMEDLIAKYGVKEFDLYDDTFNFQKERAEEIAELIVEKNLKVHLRLSNGIRVENIDEKFLEKMKAAGCDYIALGVESGDQEMLDSIPKRITLDQIRRAVKLTKDWGMTVTCFFMFGLIGDTLESMQHTLDFAIELNPDIALFNIATPYPGTKMWKRIQEGGGKIYFQSWGDFHHTSGKVMYTYPDMASPKEIEEFYRQASREFYFRWNYMARQIPRLFLPGRLSVAIRGINRIFFASQSKR